MLFGRVWVDGWVGGSSPRRGGVVGFSKKAVWVWIGLLLTQWIYDPEVSRWAARFLRCNQQIDLLGFFFIFLPHNSAIGYISHFNLAHIC